MSEKSARNHRLECEVSVSLTRELVAALESATTFYGLRASQYVRTAVTDKLYQDGFLEKDNKSRKAAPETDAAVI